MKQPIPELLRFLCVVWLVAWGVAPRAAAQTAVEIDIRMVPLLILTGEPGTTVVVQWADALGDTNQWFSITNVVLGNSPFLWCDIGATQANKRFYRARITQSPPPSTNSIVPALVWIAPGTFTMGSPQSEANRDSDEGPQTKVTLTNGFWMGEFEVTQREYLDVMGSNPSDFKGDLDRPVDSVSWRDATNYCEVLTTRERAAGRLPVGYLYRLPTEAEWEFACRAGTTTPYAFGSSRPCGFAIGSSLGSTEANFDGNFPYVPSGCQVGAPSGPFLARTTKVGSYVRNAWGLYDMHGNAWEWCLDWWTNSLPGGSVTNPRGPTSGSYRVLRGGSWSDYGVICRSANRSSGPDFWSGNSLGFRLVLAPGQP